VTTFKNTVLRGALAVFAAVAKLFSKSKEIDTAITEVKDLLQESITAPGAANYAKAGRILYLERVIEAKLRTDIATATGPKLPHHTLLAKDKDPSHPEVRLAYNLAAALAVEVTTEILYRYASGSSINSVEAFMRGYYVHPAERIAKMTAPLTQKFSAATDALYGERWSFFAENDDRKILL
jgi:hypothetical protein